jgi:ribosomal protein S18 acetylase RimI-like enzyme
MNAFHVSSALLPDIPALNALVNAAYRGDRSRRGWTTEADLLDGIRTDEGRLREMIESPNSQILKLEEAGTLLGCVYLETKGDALYLGMLTVSPERQDRGLGRQLLEAAEQVARERSCRRITMTVIPQRTELIAWYERRGYCATGETQPFPSEDPRFGLPRVPLSFVVLEKVLVYDFGTRNPYGQCRQPLLQQYPRLRWYASVKTRKPFSLR